MHGVGRSRVEFVGDRKEGKRKYCLIQWQKQKKDEGHQGGTRTENYGFREQDERALGRVA